MGLDSSTERILRQEQELKIALLELHHRVVQWDTGWIYFLKEFCFPYSFAGESKVFLNPVDTRIAPVPLVYFPAQFKAEKKCITIVSSLLCLQDYYFIIKTPIDLGQIGQKLEDGTYKSAWTYMVA